IQNRMGYWRRQPTDSLRLLDHPERGTIAGEGAAFFLLEDRQNSNTYAVLNDVEMLFRPVSPNEITHQIHLFLERNGLKESDIDILLLGKNGDIRFDQVYDDVLATAFPIVASCSFKQLCGEYMTASSFGLWLASKILKEQRVPEILFMQKKPAALKRILLYNHYRGINHSFILISQA
ncbi:MAG: 3-oxoacyl-ACP synthase, partial [Bacteroidia bacterium]|nr:3-oxoacyl-ACP synthase [Bacteroidia bacterium]